MIVSGTQRRPREVLSELREQFPDAPFLALGQTVFWDEPVKASLLKLLADFGLGGHMVVGVHDTDYFAKTHIRRAGPGRFALMPHNDGTTRDLWSAAGEISTLFGSETFPARDDFAKLGVAFEKVAKSHPMGRQAFLDEITEAWGWRGLVYTGSRDLIVNRLALREVGDGILEMLSWGFEQAVPQIGPDCCQHEARNVAELILGWCREYRAAHPDKNLTHLFQFLLPRLYTLVMGEMPPNITVDCTTNLLRLTPETAHLPRFRFVDLFLSPATRDIAVDAYNQVVANSTIYTLDKFGAGALPFDLVLPQQGRGTLRVTPRVLFVETPQPVAIALKKPIESIQELAAVLHAKLGDEVTLVGKAVSLISMLAQEFIFVFHEEGSMYVSRTRQMNDTLARKGVALDLRPILRLRYNTWDALTVATSTLYLPDFLAASFGQKTITTPEFAVSWQNVVAEQERLCQQIAAIRKPLELMHFLRDRDPAIAWDEQKSAYLDSKGVLMQTRLQTRDLQESIQRQYQELRSLKIRSQALQRERGDHFRSVKRWTPDETERREGYAVQLDAIEREKRLLCSEIQKLKAFARELETSDVVRDARARMMAIERAAENARLILVRNALLTIKGLPHTNHRPSVWWLPMVDSTGGWFKRIAETAEVYCEPLLS